MRVLNLHSLGTEYWYREELAGWCRTKQLPAWGTKAELNRRIAVYLKTSRVIGKMQSKVRFRKKIRTITPRMSVVGDGFRFNDEARRFFADHLGMKTFHFTKQMAQAVRKAEAVNDLSLKVSDLLDIYQKSKDAKKSGKTYTLDAAAEKTGQWNRFVRDFSRDPLSRNYKNRLKAAAYLWNQVRVSSGPKIYSANMIKQLNKLSF